MNHNTNSTLLISVVIMFVFSFLLSYYLNETISLNKNITNNFHKLYMAAFMAFQMAIIEFGMHAYFFGTISNMLWLLLLMTIGLFYSGYQLYTLNFMDKDQYLLSMIEHHEHAIVMSNRLKDNINIDSAENKKLKQLIDNIIVTQEDEIEIMKQLLNNKN